MNLHHLAQSIAAFALLTSGCSIIGTTVETIPASPSARDTSEAAPVQSIQTQINGISIGLAIPADWRVEEFNGLVMVEPSDSRETEMAVYLFVPPPDEFRLTSTAQTDNYAYAVLQQVVQMPSQVGYDVSITQPDWFIWDSCNAAYYLLTSGDGVNSMVLAIQVPGQQQLVVLNISQQAAHADLIREKLPTLLDGLTINGSRLSGISLDSLPDPLPFPTYVPAIPQLAEKPPLN